MAGRAIGRANKHLLLTLILLYNMLYHINGRRVENKKCENLTIDMCKDMKYNKTLYPNNIGHSSQKLASLDLDMFRFLVESGGQCGAHARDFLCFAYAPVCTVLDEPLPPCRPHCVKAKESCRHLTDGNFLWPQFLDCDLFPEQGLCVEDTAPYTDKRRKRQGEDEKRTGRRKPAKSTSRGKAKQPEFCERGFLIAQMFSECWEENTDTRDLKGSRPIYTPQMLHDYASHMCGVVKPKALSCLRDQLSVCSNVEKLMKTADSSGGACTGNSVNPYFQNHVIKYLKPIPTNSPCFGLGTEAVKCYEKAGEKAIKSDDAHDNVSEFFITVDNFFNTIWDCHIDLFKGKSDVCPNWQLPMLLSIQHLSMTSIFGLRLKPEHVAMLGLGDKSVEKPTLMTKPTDHSFNGLLLLRVIADQSEAEPGDIMLSLNTEEGDYHPTLSLGTGHEDHKFMADINRILKAPGGVNMKALRKKIREQKKKQKEIKAFIKGIKNNLE